MKTKTMLLLLTILLLPALAMALNCGSYNGSASGCSSKLTATNIQTGKAIKGVQLYAGPWLVCTTGSGGTCSNSIGNGTYTYQAVKPNYLTKVCLSVPCNNQGWTWTTTMQFTGEWPTVAASLTVKNRIEWDPNGSDATSVVLYWARIACTGNVETYIATVPVSAGHYDWVIPTTETGLIHAWFNDLDAQSPTYAPYSFPLYPEIMKGKCPFTSKDGKAKVE